MNEDELNLKRINRINQIRVLIVDLEHEIIRILKERTDIPQSYYNSGNLADYGDKTKPEKD